MKEPHVIQLGQAWETPGPAGWTRRFGRPSGLGAGERVWLAIERPAACTLVVNEVTLPACPAADAYRTDITPLLRDRNVLVLMPLAGADGADPVPPPAAGTAAHGRRSLPAAYGRVHLEIVGPE